MFRNLFSNSNEWEYFDSIANRASVSDDAFHREYYANSRVTLETCVRVRRVLCEQLRSATHFPMTMSRLFLTTLTSVRSVLSSARNLA